MNHDRRTFVVTALGTTAALAAARAEAAPPTTAIPAPVPDLVPDTGNDVSALLQAAIDRAAERKVALALPSGHHLVSGVTLRTGSVLTGQRGAVLVASRAGAVLTATGANDLRLSGIATDGSMFGTADDALLAFKSCDRVRIEDLTIAQAGGRGVLLDGCSGTITACRISNVDTAIHGIDATGLAITDNDISDCTNNGILVWRTAGGGDGSIVARNRIARIAAKAGGSGQNGNGVNVFRAGGVLVEGNRISDCAYSAVRANAASNVQMVANSCSRIGEVALYAEFGFEGALIASNVVDGAASGIAVTNFNEGGRLAVVQGNLIRNLARREHEPQDKRGEGISVEADASVTGNTIENAATAGIVVGWGRHMRDCVVTGNLVRAAPLGILVSADASAGACLVSGNMISGAKDGAIRAHDHGKPFGPDLVREATDNGRVRISGNISS